MSYLLMDEKGRTYLVKGDDDVHTKDGIIKKAQIKRSKGAVETHLGRRFFVMKPNIADFMRKAKLGPQRISLKDCALIATYAGISSGSRVVEAGTGSGVLSMFLANIAAPEKLVSYEIREDFAGIAKSNLEKAGICNVRIKMKDIYEGISEKRLDAVILDLPEPWKVVPHAEKSLRVGGYVVSYSPSIEQSKKFFDSVEGPKFYAETIECLVRDWDMKVVRPYTRMLAHTGFITFARFLGK